jgi:hypothetical protein
MDDRSTILKFFLLARLTSWNSKIVRIFSVARAAALGVD